MPLIFAASRFQRHFAEIKMPLFTIDDYAHCITLDERRRDATARQPLKPLRQLIFSPCRH
jgi:hypothetical protein